MIFLRPLSEVSTPSWKFWEHFASLSNSLSCSILRIGPVGVKALVASSSTSWIFKPLGNLAQCLKHSHPVGYCWSSMVPLSPRSCWFCCKQCSPPPPSPQLSQSWQWVGPGSWISISPCCSWPVHLWCLQTSTKSPPARGKQLCFHGARTPQFLKRWVCLVGQLAQVIKKHISAESRALMSPAHRQGSLPTQLSSYWQGRENEKHGNLISSHYTDLI